MLSFLLLRPLPSLRLSQSPLLQLPPLALLQAVVPAVPPLCLGAPLHFLLVRPPFPAIWPPRTTLR